MNACHRLARRVVTLAAVLACAHAQPGVAQPGERLALGVSAARSQMRTVGFGSEPEQLSGFLLGIEGRASFWWLHARGEYRQGRLDRESPGGSAAEVIEARASLGIRPFSWLALTAGPSFSKVGIDGYPLVVRWQVELHGAVPLIQGIASGFASIGGSVAGTDVDYGSPFRSGGGEVGLLLGGPDRPIWARLGYRVQRENLLGGSWQTAETTHLAVGVSVPKRSTQRE